MTQDEQLQLLSAIRASLRSALGGLDLYLRRLEGEGTLEDGGDPCDDQEPTDLAGVAAALGEAARALRPPTVTFPAPLDQLRALLDRFDPEGKVQ